MRRRLEGLLQHALQSARSGGALKSESLPPLILEIPRDPSFGDLASTVALGLARSERRPPQVIAEAIRSHIDDPQGLLAGVEIAGAGYLNFRFSANFWRHCLIDLERDDCGIGTPGAGRRILVEYVSANPTGPLHVGHGRGAVLGDAVARLLRETGYDVTREYYINDAGKQVATLASSALVRLRQAWGDDVALPEDGYPGDYLRDLMAAQRDTLTAEITAAVGSARPPAGEEGRFLAAHAEIAVAHCGRRAAALLLELIKDDLNALAVEMDNYVSEQALRDAGVVEQALQALERGGWIYEAEGARWFRSSHFGDEKDRVIERSNGELTYFAADVGYHQQKLQRGFDELIDVWGADHHGYVSRVAAAIEALGMSRERFAVLLVQLVRLTRGGEPVRMGKRSGEFVTLREVIDEVGRDATRFFFLMRKGDSQLEFDLDLAVKQSSENPVFYVQYAHARICSLFRQAAEAGLAMPAGEVAAVHRLDSGEEQALVKALACFSDTVEEAAAEREPHRMVFYLIDLAGCFHRFYNRHRVIGEDAELNAARLYLVGATRRVLQRGLSLVGVAAPESM